jgi:enoyl-CoA hydratase/carnithine racemase
MTSLVTRDDADGVARLTFNRPDALNALNPALFVTLRAHLDAIADATDTVGCVVLTGAGRSFSAGNDLKAIQAGETAPTPEFQAETIEALEALPQPTIAAVRGHCYTGALELALACDLLVAGQSAKFADTHGKWAMTPRWGMSQRLPRRIGPLLAKEMMYTGRVVSGAEAVRIGLANDCVADPDVETRAHELAASIAANSWHSLRGVKMLVNQGQNHTLADGLAFERDQSPGRGPDLEERLRRFGAK